MSGISSNSGLRRPPRRWIVLACIALSLPWLVGISLFHDYSPTVHNDDWLYGRSAQVLADEGYYQHVSQHGELAASVVTHVVWGRLFVWGEFSFRALHVSQAVAGWLTCVGVLLVILALGGKLEMALLAAGSLAITPLFYGHTFTFMTDVTAMMFITYALLFFIRSENLQRLRPLILGSLLTALVFWCRQTHVLIVLCPLFVLWQRREHYSWRQVLIRLAVLGGFPLFALIMFELAGLVPGNESRTGTLFIKTFDLERLKQIAIYLYGTGLLLGMLLLPMSAILTFKWYGKRRLALKRFWMVLVAGAWLAVFVATGGRAYITQSVGYFLHNAHFGPVLFADPPHPDGSWTYLADVKWAPLVWQFLTICSILSLALSASAALTRLKIVPREAKDLPETRRYWRSGVFWFALTVSLCMLTVVENIVDRHWMVLFVPAVIWVATSDAFLLIGRPGRLAAALVWVAGMSLGYISMSFTHDWLAFNHERQQQMVRWLEEDGLRPQDIDVGMDLNGWLRTTEDYASTQRSGDETRSWRGLATYALAHRPRKGWKVIGTRTWYSWATEAKQTILLLQKEE